MKTTKIETVLPVLNLNGDLPEQIYTDQRKVYNAARELQAALMAATPHGRNWQTAPGGYPDAPGQGYDEAREAHYAHLNNVNQLVKNSMAIMVHCKEHPRFDLQKFNQYRAEAAGPIPTE